MNNDGKRAKYKVVKTEEDGEDILYYCMKCAFTLVEQRFEVQNLTMEDIRQIKSRLGEGQGPMQARKQEGLRGEIVARIGKLQQGKEEFLASFDRNLADVDTFYNSVIEHIEQQRVKDRQQLIRMRNQLKSEPERLERELGEALNRLSQPHSSVSERVIEKLLTQEGKYPIIGYVIETQEEMQERFDEFTRVFHEQIRLKLENQAASKSAALQFSFENSIQMQRNFSRKLLENQMDSVEEENG